MTQQHHPITPPDVLVYQWTKEASNRDYTVPQSCEYVATQAARWGAGQELEACCEWLELHYPHVYTTRLKRCRRPKPPSLKEQALSALYDVPSCADDTGEFYQQNIEIIKTALEALPD